MHTAQHLVSALFYTLFSLHTVAVHLGEEYLTVELKEDDVTEEELEKLELEANGHILSSLRVYSRDMDRKDASDLHMRRSIKVDGDEVKVVVIENTDEVPCGGVHVRNTRELRHISYLRKEHIRGHVRTIWKCAEDAVAWRHGNRRIISALSALFSAEPDKLYAAAERQIAETAELKRKAKHAERIAAHALLSAGNGDVPVIFSDIPASSFEDEKERMFLALDCAGRFLVPGSAALFVRRKADCNIKGGGRNELFMGSYKDNAEEFMKKAKEILDGREEA